MKQLASFSRLIRFDKRGTGLSDRFSAIPTLAERMDDVRAVTDAVGSTRAAILGMSEGGPMSIVFAATYPQRTSALILYGSFARWAWAPDNFVGQDRRAQAMSESGHERACPLPRGHGSSTSNCGPKIHDVFPLGSSATTNGPGFSVGRATRWRATERR
jgi:pimeloyl-ACP methyl ester carboxylesterase